MKIFCKYFKSSFIVVVCCLLQKCCLAQSTTVRPYKFGFTIDEQQHRSEQRDERGIVMGEFGFITADGIYHVTVYATDEQGRFRILAMKNYPYESPPKTVEVMVQPKIKPTTTTAKPLPKNNFYNEACSGCFLTNGNNKPKDPNGLEGKVVKNDIRPLSKPLPNANAPSSGTTGNILNTKHVPVLLSTTELPVKLLNTPLIPIDAFKDLNALKQAVKKQEFNNAPLAPKEFSLKHTETRDKPTFNIKPLTLTPKPDFHATNIQEAKDKHVTNTNPLALAPKIVAEVVAKENVIQTQSLDNNLRQKPKTTPNNKVNTNVALKPEHNHNLEATLKIPNQLSNNKFLHNAPTPSHKQIQHQNQALSNLQNNVKSNVNNYNTPLITDKPKSLINNVPQIPKIKPITFLKQDLPTTNKTPEINNSKPRVESPENTFVQNSFEPSSDNEKPGNILQNQPNIAQPTILNQNSAKPTVQNPINIKPLNTKYTPTPTAGQKTQQQLPSKNTNKLPTTTYTSKPSIAAPSKDTNQQTSKPTQGGVNNPGSATKTNTINPPPIMDIIMQKVLPALMGNKGQQSPSNINTPKTKPNAVPTNNKPNTGISASIPNKKFAGVNNSGSSSLNGDGDLYRFKYILDYHGHSETGKRNGNKQGSYFSIGDDNVERTIEYVANEFGYQPRIRWRKLDSSEIKSQENTLKDYEFVWFKE